MASTLDKKSASHYFSTDILIDAFSFLSRRRLEMVISLVCRRFCNILRHQMAESAPYYFLRRLEFPARLRAANRSDAASHLVLVNATQIRYNEYREKLQPHTPMYLRVEWVSISVDDDNAATDQESLNSELLHKMDAFFYRLKWAWIRCPVASMCVDLRSARVITACLPPILASIGCASSLSIELRLSGDVTQTDKKTGPSIQSNNGNAENDSTRINYVPLDTTSRVEENVLPDSTFAEHLTLDSCEFFRSPSIAECVNLRVHCHPHVEFRLFDAAELSRWLCGTMSPAREALAFSVAERSFLFEAENGRLEVENLRKTIYDAFMFDKSQHSFTFKWRCSEADHSVAAMDVGNEEIDELIRNETTSEALQFTAGGRYYRLVARRRSAGSF